MVGRRRRHRSPTTVGKEAGCRKLDSKAWVEAKLRWTQGSVATSTSAHCERAKPIHLHPHLPFSSSILKTSKGMASESKAEPNEFIPYKQLNRRRDQMGGNALEPLRESACCALAQATTCVVAYGGGWGEGRVAQPCR